MTTLKIQFYCFVAVFALFAFALAPGLAESGIDWNALGLTPEQHSRMKDLEGGWRGCYSKVQPQIQRDQQELRKMLMTSPNADPSKIQEVQSRIQTNEDYLRQEATRTFLRKKEVLTPQQRQTMIRFMHNGN
jgi:Spy/CpxP family protein refolding chaperone